jgi:tRNA A37 methylthiotransferase MiaB
LAVQAQMSLAHHQALIGQRATVLVERVSRLKAAPASQGELVAIGQRAGLHTGPRKAAPAGQSRLIGRTPGDELVAFDGPEAWLGEFVQVQVTDATSVTLRGTAVPAALAAQSA